MNLDHPVHLVTVHHHRRQAHRAVAVVIVQAHHHQAHPVIRRPVNRKTIQSTKVQNVQKMVVTKPKQKKLQSKRNTENVVTHRHQVLIKSHRNSIFTYSTSQLKHLTIYIPLNLSYQ